MRDNLLDLKMQFTVLRVNIKLIFLEKINLKYLILHESRLTDIFGIDTSFC